MLIIQWWEFIPHNQIQIQILIWETILLVAAYLCWYFANTKSPYMGELPSTKPRKKCSWNVLYFANPRLRQIPFRITGQVSAVFSCHILDNYWSPAGGRCSLLHHDFCFPQFSTSSRQQNKLQLYDISRCDFHPSDPFCICSAPLCL